MGTKFREDFYWQVFNLAIFLQTRKTRNQRPTKISTDKALYLTTTVEPRYFEVPREMEKSSK